MKCWRCENQARGVCRFCGRAVCQEHASEWPFIFTIYVGENRTPKAVVGLAEIVFELDMRPSEARGLLDTLVEKGYLRTFEVEGEQHYKAFLARRRRRKVPLNIWEALGDKVE